LYINWGLFGTFRKLDIIYLQLEGPEVSEAYGLSRERFRASVKRTHDRTRVEANDPRIIFLTQQEIEDMATGVRRDANGVVIARPVMDMSSSELEGEKERIRTRWQERIDAVARLVDDQQREERRSAAVRAAEIRASSNSNELTPSHEKITLTPEKIQDNELAEAQRAERRTIFQLSVEERITFARGQRLAQ